jgi:hypothetical protein
VLWSIVPFEALDQPPGFGGRKGCQSAPKFDPRIASPEDVTFA